jgi:hypothetical protein
MRRSNKMNKSIGGRYCIRVGSIEEGISDNRGCPGRESRALSRDGCNFVPTTRQQRNEPPPHVTGTAGHKNRVRHLCRIDGGASSCEPALVAQSPCPPQDGLAVAPGRTPRIVWILGFYPWRMLPICGNAKIQISLASQSFRSRLGRGMVGTEGNILKQLLFPGQFADGKTAPGGPRARAKTVVRA